MSKKMPNYGSNKNHKVYDNTNLIINNNTYIDHVIKKNDYRRLF